MAANQDNSNLTTSQPVQQIMISASLMQRQPTHLASNKGSSSSTTESEWTQIMTSRQNFPIHTNTTTTTTAPSTSLMPSTRINHEAATKRIKSFRVKLFILVRILFKYLEKVNDTAKLTLAKAVLKDCELKHRTKDSKYQTLAEAIHDRLRDAVGEVHWMHARRIQKRLYVNHCRQRTAVVQSGLAGLGQQCTL